jgi:hypothetical protein
MRIATLCQTAGRRQAAYASEPNRSGRPTRIGSGPEHLRSEVREAMRPQVAELARMVTSLASEGIAM